MLSQPLLSRKAAAPTLLSASSTSLVTQSLTWTHPLTERPTGMPAVKGAKEGGLAARDNQEVRAGLLLCIVVLMLLQIEGHTLSALLDELH